MLYKCSAVVVFLFVAGLCFTGANVNLYGPNFHPKLAFGGPNYGATASHAIRLARQHAILLHRMRTTALAFSI